MPIPGPNSSASSIFWRNHFLKRRETAQDLPWQDPYMLSPEERASIQGSIQQFQLGEGSNGERLLKRALDYAASAQDPDFSRAIRLFIEEEQRHSAYLLRLMQREGISQLSSHWVDTAFRRVRGLAGLELSLRVLVTAEIIAVPYYRALRDATKSPLLQAICARILQDEAAHLRFQASMLSRLARGRGRSWHALLLRIHRLFLLGTACIVWVEHRRVFVAADRSLRALLEDSLYEMAALDRASLPDASSAIGKPRAESSGLLSIRHSRAGSAIERIRARR